MSSSSPADPRKTIVVHPLVVRLTHWINAFALGCMVASGWQIYNASPLLPFTFPAWATLGGWLGGGIAWHLAAMWLLVANALIYFAYGLFGRHFRRTLLPITPGGVWRDLRLALSFKLQHELGVYNAVQRLLYLVSLLLGVLAVLSGLALWKPVQLQVLDDLVGGYPVVRWIHFGAMAGLVGFFVIHIALVILVPRTLPSMITGRGRPHDVTVSES
ncbi:cytochrome b/b6 domain-containing protein [Lichenicoccus roseus]|uniref:Cytochrome b/b6 domain-containing protein n=1 Tax=Lichenicoccus roseus TaxID=2683649 RepID=A0A5R9J8D3_9PROT|nr:cytochrome b/b6 domain-containing protein [Lichenicoccus roseus]TLU73880.1 cytochrome b/b6 domain-containing protein [Lichenicoccus roseus]